jgi:asparagine synthase (glutamine-hydrolysing)
MCGIAGLISETSLSNIDDIVHNMGRELIHRGPDDFGEWSNSKNTVCLGHRRLSIVETSNLGHQPMVSNCSRYVIVFNGEIYNYKKLKNQLTHLSDNNCLIKWRGGSDTEVLLAYISKFGLKKTLTMLIGMFSFALWDKKLNTLSLVRDRIGEKPLYYGFIHGNFVFCSDLKALKAYPGWAGVVDRGALSSFVKLGYVPSQKSIYKNFYKLLPGTILEYSKEINHCKYDRYWDIDTAYSRNFDAFDGSMNDAIKQVDLMLQESVSDQMIADVPLGGFLSGGVDSSLVIAYMQSLSAKPVKTFTIGFNDKRYNEAPYANNIAKHLGTDHSELILNSSDVLSIIGNLPKIYSEPFADSSQIPTTLISEFASKSVTVALTGDGGDELFGGYNRHISASRIWRKSQNLPKFFRDKLFFSLRKIPSVYWDNIFSWIFSTLSTKAHFNNIGDKIQKICDIANANNEHELYFNLTTFWKNENIVINTLDNDYSSLLVSDFKTPEQRIMCMDMANYLPDDILVKTDRASMFSSLELRAPLLSNELVEFSLSLPLSMKIQGQTGKLILRELLYKHVPKKMIDRPKTGFSLPLDQWLRGPLKEWAEDLLDSDRLISDGFFDASKVQDKWHEHKAGVKNNHHELWNVLMFQAWAEEYIP